MRPCSAALKAFLEGPAREAYQVDLYTVRLVTGETFRWTAGNNEVTVPAAGLSGNQHQWRRRPYLHAWGRVSAAPRSR